MSSSVSYSGDDSSKEEEVGVVEGRLPGGAGKVQGRSTASPGNIVAVSRGAAGAADVGPADISSVWTGGWSVRSTTI